MRQPLGKPLSSLPERAPVADILHLGDGEAPCLGVQTRPLWRGWPLQVTARAVSLRTGVVAMGCCPVLQLGEGGGFHFTEGWERGATPPPPAALQQPGLLLAGTPIALARCVCAAYAPRVF